MRQAASRPCHLGGPRRSRKVSWSHGKQAGGPGGNGRNHGWGRGYPRPAGSQPSQQGAQVSFPRAGAGASTSQYQGPGSSGGFQREAQRLRGPWQGTKRRQCHVSEEGRRTECVALSAKPGVQGLGAGLQAGRAPLGGGLRLWVWLWALGPAGRVRGRPQLWAGRRAGQCLRGFPGGRRRLLHRWHKEAPAWGCPGAGQPL